MDFKMEKYFQKYRIPLIVGICLVLLAPISYGIFKSVKESKVNEYANKVYVFSKSSLIKLKDGSMTSTEFINQYSGLLKDTNYSNTSLLVLLEAADVMIKSNQLKLAEEILEIGKTHFNSEYERVLIGLRLAAVYEDLGDNAKAIKLLEEMANSKIKILDGKINLDLGRLYKKVNNPAKAKEKFQYVLNNFDEEVYKKLAQINLLNK